MVQKLSGGPDRREKGSRPRQDVPARYSVRDLFADADPSEVRIWGNEDKNTALGRPGAAALATGNRQAAGRSLRNTERVFIKFMQHSGKLAPNKRAFGYRPTFRQLGRIRAFMDHQIDFTHFAEEIWVNFTSHVCHVACLSCRCGLQCTLTTSRVWTRYRRIALLISCPFASCHKVGGK
eukprot:5373998-Amphidinium_carterae.1